MPQVLFNAILSTAATPPPPPPVGKLKHNPGHYISNLSGDWSHDNASLTNTKAMMSNTASHKGVKGWLFFMYWNQMESPTSTGVVGTSSNWDGSWTTVAGYPAGQPQGFALWDALIAYANSLSTLYGQTFHCCFHNYTYGGASSPGGQGYAITSASVPTYLGGSSFNTTSVANSTTGVLGGVWVNSSTSSGSGVAWYPRTWDPAVMTRLVNMMQAYGNRYDSNPTVAVVSWLDESVISSPDVINNSSGTLVGAGNYFQAGRAAWPTTRLRWWANYLNDSITNGQMFYQMQAAKASYWDVGGPDSVAEVPIDLPSAPQGINPSPNRWLNANHCWRGLYSDATLVQFTSPVIVGQTSASMHTPWALSSGNYTLSLSDKQQHTATLTNGSTFVTWVGGATAPITQIILTEWAYTTSISSGLINNVGQYGFMGINEGDDCVLRGSGQGPPAQFGSGYFWDLVNDCVTNGGGYFFWTYFINPSFVQPDPSVNFYSPAPNCLDYIDYSAGYITAANSSLTPAKAPPLNITYPPGFPH
jgi:hypothetical protein